MAFAFVVGGRLTEPQSFSAENPKPLALIRHLYPYLVAPAGVLSVGKNKSLHAQRVQRCSIAFSQIFGPVITMCFIAAAGDRRILSCRVNQPPLRLCPAFRPPGQATIIAPVASARRCLATTRWPVPYYLITANNWP